MKIGIVRLSSLGDIVFGMAALQLIRRHVPGARITWVADSKFADILDHNPDLESVVKLNLKGLKRQFSLAGAAAECRKVIAAGRFDLVIDLHGMIKSATVAAFLSRRRAGFHRDMAAEPLAALLYGKSFRVSTEVPAVHRFALLAAAALGFEFSEQELMVKEAFLFHAESDARSVAPWFSSAKKNVILVPGSSGDYKNYPKEKYLKIVQSLDAHFLVSHGNESERMVAQYLAEHCDHVTTLPRLSLNELKAAVSRADLMIGGDTGPIHLAWGCNVPSITLYVATPANCVYPGPLWRAVTPGSLANESRPDGSDFSVHGIEETAVIGLAEGLLRSTPLRPERTKVSTADRQPLDLFPPQTPALLASCGTRPDPWREICARREKDSLNK